MKVLVISIDNPEVNEIFHNLKSNFGSDSIPSNPHITVRGPQKNFKKETTDNMLQILNTPDFAITVCGTDIFKVTNDYYVFLKIIDMSDLKPVWRKPDYPIREFGYNPHITIYRGNKSTAEKISKQYSNLKIQISRAELSPSEKNLKNKELSFN